LQFYDMDGKVRYLFCVVLQFELLSVVKLLVA
jgi:hypothetical protein